MWAFKTRSGRWQYVERYTDPVTLKRKTASVTLDGHKRTDIQVAKDLLRERIAHLANKAADSPATFGELVTRYLRAQGETLKPQTVKGNTFKLRKIEELIGKDAVYLTAPYVREALKGKSYNERLKHFKALMRWAYREELVDDISYLAKLPPIKAKKNPNAYMEKDEFNLFMDGIAPQWELLTLFLVLSGLRIGEALALEDSDIGREIHVTKTLSLVTGEISTTKTETSTRDVWVQDELRECIDRILEQKQESLGITGKWSDHFFQTADGHRLKYASYSKYFRERSEKVLGRRLTPHSLRHTHVALMAENGVPLEVISRRLGHADSRITRDVYFHVTERLKERDGEAIKNVKLV